MSIAPLPASSIASLTSSQTLTNPPSLLKELIENSLDAGSTSISVEVSPNLLDSLQVRDNGHGISPEGRDRELVAKRHCTSKLRGMLDLALVRSLGFRGEALASAAEMGELKITTRVDGEKTAIILEVDKGGNVVSQKPTSAPQGTTIKVTNFLKGLPVRREVVAKAPQKLYPQIRKLLITYALSRPDVRFSFRIVGGPKKSTGKSEDWVYAPSKVVQEAVTKIVGKELSSNCTWKEIDTSEVGDDVHLDPEGMKIEALLINPGTDPKKVGKKGHATAYIFVDNRPVSTARPGIFKSIITIYKSYLKSAHPEHEAYSDPFIYLNFNCPLGFYDPNVEPAKDDVIFTNSSRVLEDVEKLFKSVYGEKEGTERGGGGKSAHEKAGVERQEGFNLLLARKDTQQVINSEGASSQTFEAQDAPERRRTFRIPQPEEKPAEQQRVSSPERGAVEIPDNTPQSDAQPTAHPSSEAASRKLRTRKPTNWGTNMHSGELSSDEEEMLRPELDNGLTGPNEEEERDSTNPWILAKMNARLSSSIHPSSSLGVRSSSPVQRQRDSSPPIATSRQRMQPSQETAEPSSKRQRLSQADFGSSPFIDDSRRMGLPHQRNSQRKRRVADEEDTNDHSSQMPSQANNLDNWIVSSASSRGASSRPQPRTEEDLFAPAVTQELGGSSFPTTPRNQRRVFDAPIRQTPTSSTRSTPHPPQQNQFQSPTTPTQPNSSRRRRLHQDTAFDHLITTPFKSPLAPNQPPQTETRPIPVPVPNSAIGRAGFQTASDAFKQGIGGELTPPPPDPADIPQVLPEPFINALLFPNRGQKPSRNKSGNTHLQNIDLDLDDLDAEMPDAPAPKSKEILSTSDLENDEPSPTHIKTPHRQPRRRLITPEAEAEPELEPEADPQPPTPPPRKRPSKRTLTALDLLVVGPTARIQPKHHPEDWLKPLLFRVRDMRSCELEPWAKVLDNEDAYLGRCVWEDEEVKDLLGGWLAGRGVDEGGWEVRAGVAGVAGVEEGEMEVEGASGEELEME